MPPPWPEWSTIARGGPGLLHDAALAGPGEDHDIAATEATRKADLQRRAVASTLGVAGEAVTKLPGTSVAIGSARIASPSAESRSATIRAIRDVGRHLTPDGTRLRAASLIGRAVDC